MKIFHQHKSPFLIDNIDINKIVVSSQVSFGKKNFKYFIGDKDAKNRPLCIFLPKKSAYRINFDKTTCMSFVIKNETLFEKYNEIFKNFSNTIKKRI